VRVVQPEGTKGSLRWIQRAIEFAPEAIQPKSLPEIVWKSPTRSDEFAEYRDGSFLKLLGLGHLASKLKDFWPSRGPQWDALGNFDNGVVLVEAKAHLAEFVSPPSQAGKASLDKINASLEACKKSMCVVSPESWSSKFYQYTNRLAHLDLLRSNGINAHLLFVDFLWDEDVNGPRTSTEWIAAFSSANAALGLSDNHSLTPFIHHVYPDVRDFG